MSNAFGARKGCVLADYQRPQASTEVDKFDDFYESLQDITIRIPGLVELSDNVILSLPTEESLNVLSEICEGWQNLTFQLNSVSLSSPCPFANLPNGRLLDKLSCWRDWTPSSDEAYDLVANTF
jgi:hypothetical protein